MINPHDPKYAAAFVRMLEIMNDLREKCPWDNKQTFESLRYLTIEETHELSEAILAQDMEEVKKEIGDVFLHLIFYAKMADEQNAFDIADVLNALAEKLIRRHPHVYGNTTETDAEVVRTNWEKLKENENQQKKQRPSLLDGVPKTLPSIVKAMRIQEKARGVGFDWDSIDQVWDKVEEELAEFKQAQQDPQTQEEAQDEFGDILFALINYARFAGINPENALERTNQKFIQRFQYIEKQAQAQSKKVSELTIDEMNVFWEEAKK
jgi:MazG family protein